MLQAAQRTRHSMNSVGLVLRRPQAIGVRLQAQPQFAPTRSAHWRRWNRQRSGRLRRHRRPLHCCRLCRRWYPSHRYPLRHRQHRHPCCCRLRLCRIARPACRCLLSSLAMIAVRHPRGDRPLRQDAAANRAVPGGPRRGRNSCQGMGCWRPAAWKKGLLCGIVGLGRRTTRCLERTQRGNDTRTGRNAGHGQPLQTVLGHFKGLQSPGHCAAKKYQAFSMLYVRSGSAGGQPPGRLCKAAAKIAGSREIPPF